MSKQQKNEPELYLTAMPEMELLCPPPTITFSFSDGGDIGTLSWEGGVFKFEGNAEESAKEFFNFLKPMIDDYIKLELKK